MLERNSIGVDVDPLAVVVSRAKRVVLNSASIQRASGPVLRVVKCCSRDR